jgi:chemotaxis protein MotB
MRKRVQQTRAGHDRWLISYADFITLLFGLFVVLYAFARADQKKQAQIPAAIDSALHAMGLPIGAQGGAENTSQHSTPSTEIVTAEQVRQPAAVKQDLERIERELKQTLSGALAAHTVSISMSRDGLVISLREAGFFDSGSAKVKPQAMESLRQIAASLGRVPYDVRVEGNTDNVPEHDAAFDSNWELSGARAMGITRLFLSWRAIAPVRLSAAGYGEFHPVASNDTPEGRAQNRRVDLLVLPRTSIDFSTSSAAVGRGAWRRVTDGDGEASQPVSE